ncbi:MAG: TRAP transporter substrate-binding protein [Alphaproteobacteria bacterium]
MILRRTALILAFSILAMRPAAAQEFVFDLQHILPADSALQMNLLEPWAEKISEDSGGRIEIVIHPVMNLGGEPVDLYDQVVDGTIDIAWTLPGFSPGRFLSIEAFELPFTTGSARAKNAALMQFFDLDLMAEFSDVRPLLFHSQSAVTIHTRDRSVTAANGFRGLTLAVPTEQAGRTLQALGAAWVHLPPDEIADGIADGSIDGLMSSYVLANALGLSDLTPYHTESGLYSSVFILAMNKDVYRSLPADLRAVIDANAGLETALWPGTVFDDINLAARDAMIADGGEVFEPSLTQLDEWYRSTRSVISEWVGRANRAGLRGQFLYDRVMLLININSRA